MNLEDVKKIVKVKGFLASTLLIVRVGLSIIGGGGAFFELVSSSW